MKVFYFSATGNSMFTALSIDPNAESMVQVLKADSMLIEDDVIGFVMPCYHGSIPTIVESFIEKHTFKAPYVFAIMTYGNIAMGGPEHFRQIASKHNLKVHYVNRLKMLDNSLKHYNMDKQVKSLERKQVDKHFNRLLQDIKDRVRLKKQPSPMTYLSAVGYKSYRKEIGDCDNLFNVEPHCTRCGVCESVCPVDNIEMESGVTFKGACIRCYACSHNCPQNAIRFEGEKSKTRYRHEKISLKDIVLANQ